VGKKKRGTAPYLRNPELYEGGKKGSASRPSTCSITTRRNAQSLPLGKDKKSCSWSGRGAEGRRRERATEVLSGPHGAAKGKTEKASSCQLPPGRKGLFLLVIVSLREKNRRKTTEKSKKREAHPRAERTQQTKCFWGGGGGGKKKFVVGGGGGGGVFYLNLRRPQDQQKENNPHGGVRKKKGR